MTTEYSTCDLEGHDYNKIKSYCKRCQTYFWSVYWTMKTFDATDIKILDSFSKI